MCSSPQLTQHHWIQKSRFYSVHPLSFDKFFTSRQMLIAAERTVCFLCYGRRGNWYPYQHLATDNTALSKGRRSVWVTSVQNHLPQTGWFTSSVWSPPHHSGFLNIGADMLSLGEHNAGLSNSCVTPGLSLCLSTKFKGVKNQIILTISPLEEGWVPQTPSSASTCTKISPTCFCTCYLTKCPSCPGLRSAAHFGEACP